MINDKQKYILEWLQDAGISDITGDSILSVIKSDNSLNTLGDLKKAMEILDVSLRNCALNMVFGYGNEKADVLLLGEAPGAEEDKQGLPFVGQSGKLLDQMLKSIDLNREKVYITNILPWRPPGNRTPTPVEIALFRPYVLRHISLINPKIVLCLGGTAAKALLKTNKGITQIRKNWTKIDELNAEILPTFHPAYLLRSPSQKREAWIDLLMLKEKLSMLNI